MTHVNDTGETAKLEGAALLDAVEAQVRRFTVLPSREATWAVVLYAAYTHASGCFQFAPRLVLTSAEKQSGKTRTMEIVTNLACDPLVSANATVAAIFRSLGDPDRPRTLAIDEADTIFGTKVKAEQNEDLRAILNTGFQVGTPVLRTVGPNHTPTEFHVFAPAILAGIGTMPDTVTDRAVNIRLRRRRNSETVEPFRIRKHTPELRLLRIQLAEWIGHHGADLTEMEPISDLEDRPADVWEPLLAVADLAGGQWPIKARQAAIKLTRDAAEADTHHSAGVELLSDAREILSIRRGDYISSADLLQALNGIEDSQWSETGLTGARLAKLLRPYQIYAGKVGSGRLRGYKVAAFQDAERVRWSV
ncbi:MAG: DUF3631 domain-containing protein [Galactobacter sp.]